MADRYLYVLLADDLNDAVAQVAALARTTKRQVVGGLIAEKLGQNHPYRDQLAAAWAQYTRDLYGPAVRSHRR